MTQLCGNPKGGCCPTAEKWGKLVIITDDYKNQVIMTYEQYKILFWKHDSLYIACHRFRMRIMKPEYITRAKNQTTKGYIGHT